MKNKGRIKSIIILVAAIVLLLFGFRRADKYFEIAKSLDIMAAVYRDLNSYYVDSISPSALMQTGIEAMAQSLDPYTYYFSENDLGDLDFQATGKYGGVGTSIRKMNDSIVVSAVYDNAPFEKAGIRPGDVILSLDKKPVTAMSMEDISGLLRGEAGSVLQVAIRHPISGKIAHYKIKREEIAVQSVAYTGMLTQHTGYIKLIQFTEGTSEEITHAYQQLKKKDPALSALILDLRGNPGGLLEEAVKTANLFLPTGDTILSTRGRVNTWNRIFTATEAPLDNQIPLAVLINSHSASASEIVAGAMQDLDRGIIVGQRSFGKGLVQTTRNLPYHTKIKITAARYYTPSGRCIQAIDYTHRNDDGSIAYIPDSLKNDFHTKDGRTVLDGGGIMPDEFLSPKKYSRIAASLVQNNLIFDYATLYYYTHSAPPKMVGFQLSDAMYNHFLHFLKDKHYNYENRTEMALDHLKSQAKAEGYFEKISTETKSIEASIKQNKTADLQKYKPEIRNLLEMEIMDRYYFQKGRIAQELPSDSVVQVAVNLLNDAAKYRELLHE